MHSPFLKVNYEKRSIKKEKIKKEKFKFFPLFIF